MPVVTAYLMAGCGVVVIMVFLGFIFAKGKEPAVKKEQAAALQSSVWAKDAAQWKSSGTLLSVTKDKNDEGVAVVSREKWDRLPFDSREALTIAVARAEEIKTLQVKDETGYNLGICRNGVRLWENKN